MNVEGAIILYAPWIVSAVSNVLVVYLSELENCISYLSFCPYQTFIAWHKLWDSISHAHKNEAISTVSLTHLWMNILHILLTLKTDWTLHFSVIDSIGVHVFGNIAFTIIPLFGKSRNGWQPNMIWQSFYLLKLKIALEIWKLAPCNKQVYFKKIITILIWDIDISFCWFYI